MMTTTTTIIYHKFLALSLYLQEVFLCECCIRKMWHAKWLEPETKILLEDIMKELKNL